MAALGDFMQNSSMQRDFPSWRSYWQFAQRVRTKSRYFRDPESEEFCELVKETSQSRKLPLLAKSTLYRAQIGEDDSDPNGQCYAHPPERMVPLPEKAVEGRANPKGIPYLYLATNVGTAIAESRAGVGEVVSIGHFLISRDLTLVDCSASEAGFSFYFAEPEPAKRTVTVWNHIDRAFSHPIQRTENSADYAPTQILAELFKEQGFDGILFKSSLGDGHNVVLFDLDVATLRVGIPYKVDRIRVDFSECGNPYFMEYAQIADKPTASNPSEPLPDSPEVLPKGISDTAQAAE